MAKQPPQNVRRFPIAFIPIFEPAHDNVDGYHCWVPGQVDLIVALEWLKGEPFGEQRISAEDAIRYGEGLIRAGKRSQQMLIERQQKEAAAAEAEKN